MVLYPAATSADSPLAHMVVHPLQLALVVLFHPPTGANTALALGQLALCGGGLCGYIYIYIYIGNGVKVFVTAANEDDGRNQTATNGALYRRILRTALSGAGVATRRRRGTPILREKYVQKSAAV